MIPLRIMGALPNCLTEKELQMKEKQIYEKKKTEGKFREKTRKLLKATLCLLFMVTVFTVPGISAKAADFTVLSHSDVYDGEEHQIFDVLDSSGRSVIGTNIYKVWYKKIGETNYREFWPNLAKAKDVSDSAMYSVIVTYSTIDTAEKAALAENQLYTKDNVKVTITKANLKNADVRTNNNSVDYDGTSQPPAVTVTLNERILKEGTDYTVMWYMNNTRVSELKNAGIYTLRVEGKGNYTGEIHNNTNSFTVRPIQLSLWAAGSDVTKTYDGSNKVTDTGNLSLAWDGADKVLKADKANISIDKIKTDRLEYQYDSSEAGKRQILPVNTTYTEKTYFEFDDSVPSSIRNNYKLTSEAKLEGEILPAELTDVNVEQEGTLIYTGAAQAPAVTTTATAVGNEQVTFYYSTDVAAATADYSSELPKFTDAGTYTVYYVARAKNHNDSDKRNFTVTVEPVSLKNTIITVTSEKGTYVRGGQKPNIHVFYAGKEIDSSVYDVSLLDANGNPMTMEKAGNYSGTVVVTANEKNYTGSNQSGSFAYTIEPKSIADFTIELNSRAFSYNRENQAPEVVSVIDTTDNYKLVKDVDYTVSVPDSKDAAVNAYYVTIAGTGNYTGSKQEYYHIRPVSLERAKITVSGTYTYNGREQMPGKDEITVVANGLPLGTDEYEIRGYVDNKDAGTATVKIGSLSKNYEDIGEGTFIIEKAPVTATAATTTTRVYNGKTNALVTGITFKGLQNGDTLSENRDYFVESAEYLDCNAGTDKQVKVKLKMSDTDNGKNYYLTSEEYVFDGQTIEKAVLSQGMDINAYARYNETGEILIDIGTGLPSDSGEIFSVKYAIADDPSGILGKADVDVTRKGKELAVTLTAGSIGQIGDTAKILLTDFITENYKGGTVYAVVTLVDKYVQSMVPELSVNAVLNGDGETYTLEIAKAAGAEYSFDGINWSQENKIANALPNTSYNCYIRYQETEEYLTGPCDVITYMTDKIYVKAPAATPGSQTFTGSIQVILSSSTPGAAIYYTLDGSEPDRNSTSCADGASITITQDTTIKAFAVKENLEDSAVMTATYMLAKQEEKPAEPGNSGTTDSDSGSDDDSDDEEEEVSAPAPTAAPAPAVSKPKNNSGTTKTNTRSDSKSSTTSKKTTVTEKSQKKGAISSTAGIIPGKKGVLGGDGYSHWVKDKKGWWFCYNDGTYPKGTKDEYCWELINGVWYAFDENGYKVSVKASDRKNMKYLNGKDSVTQWWNDRKNWDYLSDDRKKFVGNVSDRVDDNGNKYQIKTDTKKTTTKSGK